MNLLHVPMIIAEDNSKAQPRLGVKYEKGRVVLYGVNGGALPLNSSNQIPLLVNDLGMANALYVYALAPMVPHGPFMPIMAVPNDGTNDTIGAAARKARQQQIKDALWQMGMYSLGVVSDGDAQMR